MNLCIIVSPKVMAAIAFFQKQLNKIALTATVIASSAIIIGLQQQRLTDLREARTLSAEDVARNVAIEKASLTLWKQLPVYGYDNLVADWIFLRFLQYFGDASARMLGDYTLSPEFFDVILGLDPWFVESYYYLSTSTTLYAGEPARTINLFEQGLNEMNPSNPKGAIYLWRLKAIDQHLFLGDIPGAIESYKAMAAWAATKDDAQSQSLKQRAEANALALEQNPDSTLAQIRAWEVVLGQTQDPQVQQFALDVLESLGVQVRVTPDGQTQYTIPPALLEEESRMLQRLER